MENNETITSLKHSKLYENEWQIRLDSYFTLHNENSRQEFCGDKKTTSLHHLVRFVSSKSSAPTESNSNNNNNNQKDEIRDHLFFLLFSTRKLRDRES